MLNFWALLKDKEVQLKQQVFIYFFFFQCYKEILLWKIKATCKYGLTGITL